MNSSKLRKKLLILLGILLIASTIYLATKPLKSHQLTESDRTMMLTDTMRHSFKVALLVDRALIYYQSAILEQSQQKLFKALDFLDAANGFLNMNYIENTQLKTEISPLIEKLQTEMQQNRLKISPQNREDYFATLRSIQKAVEHYEQSTWINFQQDYVKFQTNEAKLITLYQVLFFIVLVFVFIASGLLFRQKQTLKKLIEKEDELEQLAFFDSVTDVMSRKAIEIEIEHAISRSSRHQKPFCLMMLDLDDFKKVNDLLGHSIGDELLKKFTERLQVEIRDIDYIGRVGGDEFLLIFEETTLSQLTPVAHRILNSLEKPFQLRNTEQIIHTSIGAVEYPSQAENKNNLMKYADIAMYVAKENGKNQYASFDVEMKSKLDHFTRQEQDISQALIEKQFEIYLQPQIDYQTKQVFGVEILSRWNHPHRGLVPPIEFIPSIENGIQIVEFHKWLISEIALLQKRWQNTPLADLFISANLSVKYLSRTNFAAEVQQLIAEHHITLEKIKFEITEYSLMESSNLTKDEIKQLTPEGFKFCLDDFGTGYSSITFLNDFPIDIIKIDKQFIDQIENASTQQPKLVNTILNIGQDMNIKVLAEGVEHEYQAEYLAQRGCYLHQGYLYGKPMPVPDFENWCHNFSHDHH